MTESTGCKWGRRFGLWSLFSSVIFMVPRPLEERGSEMADCHTEQEKAVAVLVENFYKYVSTYSLAKNKISKSSFRKMLQQELNYMLMDTGDRKAADKLIRDLDADHDGCISFEEY